MDDIDVLVKSEWLKINIEEITYKGEKRLKLIFNYNAALKDIVKMIPGSRWSQTLKCWHIQYRENYYNYLMNYFSIPVKEDNSKCIKRTYGHFIPSEEYPWSEYDKIFGNNEKTKVKEKINKYSQLDEKGKKHYEIYKQVMELKRLSTRTCDIYGEFFIQFLLDNKDKDIDNFGYKTLFYYIHKKAGSLNYTQRKQCISAIKFYFEKALGRQRMFFNLGKKPIVDTALVKIPFYQFRKICDGIQSATDKLLLFMQYHMDFSEEELSNFILEDASTLTGHMTTKNNSIAKEYMSVLLKEHIEKSGNRKYLFENTGNQLPIESLRKKVNYILKKYRLKDIYYLQLGHYLDSTDYSDQTKSTYRGMFMSYLAYFNYRHPSDIEDDEIRKYLSLLKAKSESLQNNTISALKFFYEYVYSRKIPLTHLLRPYKGHFLPNVFDREEIAAMINNEDNLKHKLLIGIGYGSGLRRSEIRNLRIFDIDLKHNVVFIRSAKGRKDRYTILSPDLEEIIEEYIEKEKPADYFFKGEKESEPYSYTSMSLVLKSAAKAVGIQRRVHLHMLRHSFGTHLLEDGYDIRYVQELMGHVDVKTTQRYTHITNHALVHVRSPLSKILISKKSKIIRSRPP